MMKVMVMVLLLLMMMMLLLLLMKKMMMTMTMTAMLVLFVHSRVIISRIGDIATVHPRMAKLSTEGPLSRTC